MSNQRDLIEYLADLTNRDVDVTEYFYDILRVHPSAEQEVVESAYRRLLRLYHPDVNKRPLAGDVTKVLIAAYGVLGDPVKRAEYDSYLATSKSNGSTTSTADREEQIAFYMERGEAYETNDKRDLAIQDFTRAIELDSYNDLACQWRGMLYALEGEYALAIQDYTKAIEIDSSNWIAHQTRGWAYWHRGNNDLAKLDLEKAIEGWIGTGAHESNIRSMLLGFGMRDGEGIINARPILDDRHTPMEQFLQEIIADGGKQGQVERQDYAELERESEAVAYFVRGVDHVLLGEHALAIEAFTNAIKLNPSDGQYYKSRGGVYRTIGKNYLALHDLNMALAARPDDAMIYFERGVVFEKLEDFDSAISDLSRAVDIDPGNALYYFERGAVFEKLEDFDSAISDLSRAIDIDPENFGDPVFRRRLGRLKDDRASSRLKRTSSVSPETKWDSNVQKYTEAISLYPHRSSNYKFRGNAYLKIGETELAIEDFNKAIELNPNSASNYEHRAKAYAEMGEVLLATEDTNTARTLRSGQHRSSSAKTRMTSASGASARIATNERARTQPAGNSSTIWTQTSQSEYQTSSQDPQQKEKSVVGECVFGSIVFAILAGVLTAAVVIFWNNTAAGILVTLLGLIALYGVWGDDGKKSVGVKVILTLCGIVLAIGISALEAYSTLSVGFALILVTLVLGVVFGITVGLEKAKE